jgi:hypothetical protein
MEAIQNNAVDIFKNPFFNNDEAIRIWDKNRDYTKPNQIIIPKHEFKIISPKEDGTRSIVWSPVGTHIDTSKELIQEGSWGSVYTWDEGAMELMSEMDKDWQWYVTLVISKKQQANHSPNITICRFFIKDIALYLESLTKRLYLTNCIFRIRIDDADTASFDLRTDFILHSAKHSW